jgi:hypothetical protein
LFEGIDFNTTITRVSYREREVQGAGRQGREVEPRWPLSRRGDSPLGMSDHPQARFEDLNMDYFRKCMEPVEKVLRDAKIAKSQVRGRGQREGGERKMGMGEGDWDGLCIEGEAECVETPGR